MHPLLTQALSTAIPQLVQSSIDWFQQIFNTAPSADNNPAIVIPKNTEKISTVRTTRYKKRDVTKLNRQQHDFVCASHRHMVVENQRRAPGTPRKSCAELTVHLNEILGLDKSRTFYSKVWNGQITRESLPEAKISSVESEHERPE